MKIHKAGYGIIGRVGLFVLAATVAGSWFFSSLVAVLLGGVMLLIFCFVVAFFRLPNRQIELREEQILSPADGKVVAIEEVFEGEYLQERVQQVSIFMSVWNVHCNWTPMAGEVRYVKHHPGKFLVAWHPKSSEENERTTYVIERADGVRVLFRQIAGLVARRIMTYVSEGDQVAQCQEFGFIKFGSRVDLFLPLDAKVEVELGQRMRAQQSLIATLPAKS